MESTELIPGSAGFKAESRAWETLDTKKIFLEGKNFV